MGIGRRLLLSFGVLLALTLGIGWLGLGYMAHLARTTDNIAHQRFAKVVLAQEGVARINRNARTALELFILADPAEISRRMAEQKETSASITELYATFAATLESDDERRLFQEIKDARAAYIASRAAAEQALVEGRRPEAQAAIETEVLPRLSRYVAAWDTLSDYEATLVEDAARDADASYARARGVTAALTAAAFVFGAIVALMVTRRVTRPILAIADAAHRLERGELGARVQDPTDDEVGILARAFNTMGEAVAFRQKRLQAEMELAQEIQAAILPRTFDVPGLELTAKMVPATEVGGDYYDVLPVEDGCWVGIGDVAGHGLRAGLIMLMIQSIEATLVREGPNRSPGATLSLLNDVLAANLKERLGQAGHATMTLLRFHVGGRVEFAGAHEEILVCRAKDGRAETIETPGTWVGVRPGIQALAEECKLVLQTGDVVLLHTDGVTEAQSAEGEMFGLERLVAELEAARDEPVDEICRRLLLSVSRFAPNRTDDVSLVIARYTGKNAPSLTQAAAAESSSA